MSKIFTRTFRVRFSECNAYGQAGTAHLVRYLVETALNTLSPRLGDWIARLFHLEAWENVRR